MSYWKASCSRPVSRGLAVTVSIDAVLADKLPECAPTLVGRPRPPRKNYPGQERFRTG